MISLIQSFFLYVYYCNDKLIELETYLIWLIYFWLSEDLASEITFFCRLEIIKPQFKYKSLSFWLIHVRRDGYLLSDIVRAFYILTRVCVSELWEYTNFIYLKCDSRQLSYCVIGVLQKEEFPSLREDKQSVLQEEEFPFWEKKNKSFLEERTGHLWEKIGFEVLEIL